MGSSRIIVREYLESLKEDEELDYLFPSLISLMGYQVVSTPKDSKGQSQYGKDIIAVRIDPEDNTKKRYYFELKGFSDQNIDDSSFLKKDGIRDSLLAIKYTAHQDSSKPGFNDLPFKVVLVHNGILKRNTGPTLNGFVEQEFPDKNFERWDIHQLTDYFSDYLFDAYLLTDDESLRLFKRTLALLDAPNFSTASFKQLVDLQIKKAGKPGTRSMAKFFATQNLLCSILVTYSVNNNDLRPAKESMPYLVIKTWEWILVNKLETNSSIMKAFSKLESQHFSLLDKYFRKTLQPACEKHGLYSIRGGEFEAIGYPIRCFEFLDDLVYYFRLRQYHPKFDGSLPKTKAVILQKKQRQTLYRLITSNDGCSRPLMDNHSISILGVVLFILDSENLTSPDYAFIHGYLNRVLENIVIIKKTRGRFPLCTNSEDTLATCVANGTKGRRYVDSSSLLITMIFEIIALLRFDDIYDKYLLLFRGEINLQIAYPHYNLLPVEELLFSKHLYNEFYCESSLQLPDSSSEFKSSILSKETASISYRTVRIGKPYLLHLAHTFHRTEWFPEDWREVANRELKKNLDV